MHDFYRAILLDARENTDSFKENAFSLLLDIFEDRVREMYYCPHCMKEFTREELSTLKEPREVPMSVIIMKKARSIICGKFMAVRHT